jgi:hypothetical protein
MVYIECPLIYIPSTCFASSLPGQDVQYWPKELRVKDVAMWGEVFANLSCYVNRGDVRLRESFLLI